jgi:hypothetical protein
MNVDCSYIYYDKQLNGALLNDIIGYTFVYTFD